MHVVNPIETYPYDSGIYWELGYEFGVDDFNFNNYSYGLRGYLYPFIHYILIKIAALGIGTKSINLWIFHSIMYAFIFTIMFPKLIEKIFCVKVNYIIRGLFALICSYFFKGLILYPLSDLPAFAFLLIALYLLILLIEDKQKYSLHIEWIYGILIGIFLAGAYYIRPVYLSAIIGFAIIAGYFIFKRKKYILICSIIGMIFIAFPQIIINHTYFNTISPMIQTEIEYKGQSLYLQQLNWGISIQKYETNMDLEAFESAQLSFYDETGKKLLEKHGPITGYLDYIKFVFLHFVDVCCIYLKHLFNGLDITYNSAYIYKLNEKSNPPAMLGRIE